MTAPLPAGSLLGAFEVIAPIGHGGMGQVYSARNRITGDERALKVILPALASRPEFVERFVREIRMAMAVEHPNLVRVFEPGMHGDCIFLPMELLVGESLSMRLQRDRVLGAEEGLLVLEAVGAALDALHAKKILHRDVKPSNIYLTRDRHGALVPKLLDLGAGKDAEGTEEATATGTAIGSPHYMAPEQASGRKDLDARVDQYALGVLTYQILTGARPYENDDTGHVFVKVLVGAPFKRPRELRDGISAELEAVVLRALSRERDDRFRDVNDMLTSLRAAWGSGGVRPAEEESTRFAPLVVSPATTHGPTGAAPAAAQDRSGTVRASTMSAAHPSAAGPAAVGVLLALGVVALAVTILHEREPGPVVAASAPGATATAPSAPPYAPPPPLLTATEARAPTLAPAPDSTSAQIADVPPPVARALHSKPHHSPAPSSAPAPCKPTPGAPCL